WEASGPNYDAGLDLKVLVFLTSAPPLESLTRVRTYVRFVCESDHRFPGMGGFLASRASLPFPGDQKQLGFSLTKCGLPPLRPAKRDLRDSAAVAFRA